MRADEHPYFDGPRPLAFAHRGGAKRWPENTLHAFEEAIARGYRHIETDIHLTRDGELVVFHDHTLDRCTDGAGPIAARTVGELQQLDAGYWWSPDGGETFPFRGQGITIPTLAEALALGPEIRFNLEMKPRTPAIAWALWDFLRGRPDRRRVLAASAFSPNVIAFRELSDGSVPSSPGFAEILKFWTAVRAGAHRLVYGARGPDFHALQIPVSHGPLTVTSERLVRVAHEYGLHVHVWTIDDPAEMRRLVALDVDGIMSDVPDVLLEVLGRADAGTS
ncbi:MAG: glycerophosphodiester phosphodiesterase [Myxococcales bacterium]|nr:glycerophosphodiester phosphodiesterase [Myxococcales bacterium]